MLLFISTIARLSSLAHSQAGVGQSVPFGQTGGKPEIICRHLLFPASFPKSFFLSVKV